MSPPKKAKKFLYLSGPTNISNCLQALKVVRHQHTYSTLLLHLMPGSRHHGVLASLLHILAQNPNICNFGTDVKFGVMKGVFSPQAGGLNDGQVSTNTIVQSRQFRDVSFVQLFSGCSWWSLKRRKTSFSGKWHFEANDSLGGTYFTPILKEEYVLRPEFLNGTTFSTNREDPVERVYGCKWYTQEIRFKYRCYS